MSWIARIPLPGTSRRSDATACRVARGCLRRAELRALIQFCTAIQAILVPVALRFRPSRDRSPEGAGKLAPMVSVPVTRSRRGLQGSFRRVLLGGLLVVGIIVGLVTMHTLNLHGTPAAQAPAAITFTLDSTQLTHVSVSAPDTGATHRGAAVGQHLSADTASDYEGACADCGAGDHLAMAMVCVLALLLVLLVLVPPRLLPGWMHIPPRADPQVRLPERVLLRAPSLHVLCISRT